MANELVQVPFHGDVIEASQDEKGDVWVPIKRPCESLGLQAHGQAEKLKGKPWAVTQMVCATASDQKSYEMYALRLDCLPMWLATIDVNRVRPEIRPKLELYQKEAARVLAEHFLGPKKQSGGGEDYDAAGSVKSLVAVLDRQQAVLGELLNKMVSLAQNGQAPPRQIADLITVENRCLQRWPGATAKNRRRVRDVGIGIHRERLGYCPFKLSGHMNGVIAFEREHLDILDLAIDIVLEEVSGSQMAPLFERPKAG